MRKPEKLWVDRVSKFHNKTLQSLLKDCKTELYSTYSNLKAVFMERFNKTFLHIINKPMFINGDCYPVNLLNDAVESNNNNKHSTINMTLVDASSNPEKFRYFISTYLKMKPKLKVGDFVRNADKFNFFSNGYTSNCNTELCKNNQFLNSKDNDSFIRNFTEVTS